MPPDGPRYSPSSNFKKMQCAFRAKAVLGTRLGSSMIRRFIGSPQRVFIAAILLCAPTLAAQTTVTFTPTNPTANDVITARIEYPGLACTFVPTTIINGATVRTTVEIFGCIVGPPAGTNTQFVPFGPIPAGTYTYELIFRYENEPPVLQAQVPLIVGAPSIPRSVPAA